MKNICNQVKTTFDWRKDVPTLVSRTQQSGQPAGQDSFQGILVSDCYDKIWTQNAW